MEEAQRVGRRRSAAALLVLWLAAAGCALTRPAPLEVPPGQRMVLGRVDLTATDIPEGYIEIVRDDRTFDYALPISRGTSDFAIALPPGRYSIARLRGGKDGPRVPNQVVWDVTPVTFEVGAEPAIYIGTLRFTPSLGRFRVVVVDEFDDTLRVVRRWHPDLPTPVVRSLASPA
jgi:hypothetical protein